MHQEIGDLAQVVGLEEYLPGLRAELEEQLRFRLEQLEGLGWALESAENEAQLGVVYVWALRAGSALAQTQAALQRLVVGTYGTCTTCAGPVALERLAALPTAALCTPCQYLAQPRRNALGCAALPAGGRSW